MLQPNIVHHTNIQKTEKEKVYPLAQVNEQYWSQTEQHSTDNLKHILHLYLNQILEWIDGKTWF